ncbi:unnamed protein product [Linum tenue]|uniref:AB hydrolase-1 domain-containing protein n=1 Tax=Linum tenue TaxID=586396 RepID=A0AAV0NTJ4_9ROSI|nr:unnamed protein product [Linum tenue]
MVGSMSSSGDISLTIRSELFHSRASRLDSPTRLSTTTTRSRCDISRRGFAMKGIVASGVSSMGSSALATEPKQGVERLPFKPEGYNYWSWRGHKIHYVVEGEGLPIVLIHGFGASAFHWRYNIPELAKMHKVYAIDLLGFGWSDKALVDYDAMVWRDQIVDFMKQIVKEPAVLVGNSLGGFTALVSAVGLPEQVVGLVLLNSAGQFGNPNAEANKTEESVLQKYVSKPVKDIFQRVVLGFLFWQAKQPARVESVLKSVSASYLFI